MAVPGQERGRDNAVTRPPASDVVLLVVAMLAIGTSGPLIAATTVGAVALAFWRSLLGSGLTLPFSLLRHRGELRGMTRAEWRGTALAGALLGAHFAAWLPSLRFTSVASSTALVALQPVWAALIARSRGAHVPRQAWVGIVVALVGVLVLTGIDVSTDPRHLIGDLLALVGGMLSAAYVTAGERVRQRCRRRRTPRWRTPCRRWSCCRCACCSARTSGATRRAGGGPCWR